MIRNGVVELWYHTEPKEVIDNNNKAHFVKSLLHWISFYFITLLIIKLIQMHPLNIVSVWPWHVKFLWINSMHIMNLLVILKLSCRPTSCIQIVCYFTIAFYWVSCLLGWTKYASCMRGKVWNLGILFPWNFAFGGKSL